MEDKMGLDSVQNQATVTVPDGPDDPRMPMRRRLLCGAERLATGNDNGAKLALRVEQEAVFADFVEYLTDFSTRPADESGEPPFGRIILPPRTGKTVVAGHIIMCTRLHSLFIVPTKTLVEQAAADLAEFLGTDAVGVYYSDTKRLVKNGVNVTTYSILQGQLKDGTLPVEIRSSAIVFADEAHQSMTLGRMTLLREAFDPDALRIALTATPDYNEERVLSRYFPHLIHEITIPEAVEMDLLAPLRVWVAEVDTDGSVVKVVQGDYQEAVLGRLMSEAPFFKAAESFRYAEENRDMPALISCVSRQQAYDLLKYLLSHRPAGTPEPALVLGDTSPDDRRNALKYFEAGKIDTLINVGVLIQGWNSPRCKLLIDLAPTVSRVRATQKFCRVLTKNGDAEARLYMIIPAKLTNDPVMPMELLAPSLEAYQTGDLLSSPRHSEQSTTRRLRHPRIHPIDDVELKSRILLTIKVEKPLLDRTDKRQVRRVLDSHNQFDPSKTPHLWDFRSFIFEHPLFTGRGDHLLRVCGFRGATWDYRNFLLRYAPDAAANLMYKRMGLPEDESCIAEARVVEARIVQRKRRPPQKTLYVLWRTMCGPLEHEVPQPDEVADAIRLDRFVDEALQALSPIHKHIIIMRFGLGGEEELTLKQIGEQYNLSVERIRQLEFQALSRLHTLCVERMKIPIDQVIDPNQTLRQSRIFLADRAQANLRAEEEARKATLEAQIRAYGVERYEELTGYYAPLPERPSNRLLVEGRWVYIEIADRT